MNTDSFLRTMTVLVIASALTGCGGDTGNSENTGKDANNAMPLVTSYLAKVTSDDGSIEASLKTTGSPPAGAGSAVAATSTGVFIPGGSKQITVTSASEFTTVVVGVEGAEGYYELSGLPSGTTAIVTLTMAQSLSQSFTLLFGAGSGTASGTIGKLQAPVTMVGTGDIQVNVSWDTPTDVDLHVEDTTGWDIYYNNKTSTSGGKLDLDSNASCTLDHKNSENITWPKGQAPHGSYNVRVDYWSACNVSTTTNYVVTVNLSGQAPQVFYGSFNAGDADEGGSFAGVDITTFTY